MFKKIIDTTATYPLGLVQSNHLFKVETGEFLGRMVMVSMSSTGEIKYSYADPPYTSWSTPVSISTSLADSPTAAVMDENSNIHLVYTTVTSNYLATIKLTYSSGSWSVGSPVVVFNANEAVNPTLAIEPGGKLWVGWARSISGTITLCVKSSTDDGASWGSGPTDAGEVLSSDSSSIFPQLVMGPTEIFLVYSDGGNALSFRSREISGGSFSSASTIASGIGLDSNFDAAVAEDGTLAVAYDHNQMNYREFDGINWGTVYLLDSNSGILPQLKFSNNVPAVFYFISGSSEMLLGKFTHRKSGLFSTPVEFDDRSKTFDAVTLYDNSAATYEDHTTDAGNATSGDVYHSSSGGLVKDSGDIAYFGMNKSFRYLYFLLSTAGAGGTVTYSYWDGTNWRSFIPASGAFELDSTEKRLLLWTDYSSIPSDWQKNIIDGNEMFWVKIEVLSSFSTAPIGSEISTISDIHAFSVRR